MSATRRSKRSRSSSNLLVTRRQQCRKYRCRPRRSKSPTDLQATWSRYCQKAELSWPQQCRKDRRPRKSKSPIDLQATWSQYCQKAELSWPQQCRKPRGPRRRKSSTCLWSEEDEITLLKCALHISRMPPTVENGGFLFGVIQKFLSVPYNSEKILRKLRFLLLWYTEVQKSSAPVLDSHDQILHDIAHKLWGVEENPNGAAVAGNGKKTCQPLNQKMGVGLQLGSELGFMRSARYHMEEMMEKELKNLQDIRVMKRQEKQVLPDLACLIKKSF